MALTVIAGFQPQLLLGISIFNHDATAGLGVFFDLPTVSATVAEVRRVNSKCENSSMPNSNTANGIVTDVIDSLTHISGEVGFNVGLLAQANLNIGGHVKQENDTYVVLSTAFPLPTACISFDRKAKTYGPANVTSTSSVTGPGHGGQKSGAASSTGNPIPQFLGEQKCVGLAAGLLILASAYFVTL